MTEPSSEAASPVELFFDLVFVFAFIQLTHHLAAHPTWRGLAETLVLLLCVLTVWVSTSWSATLIRGAQGMLLTSMALGLVMNAAIGGAFGFTAWGFVLPFVALVLGRILWTIRFSPSAAYREHYLRTLV